jgi:hypothetical protein
VSTYSTTSAWQGWQDSNPRPAVLETAALAKLSYTPEAKLVILTLCLLLTFFFLAPFTVGGNTSSRNAIASDCLPYYYIGVTIPCKGYGAGGELPG